MLNNKIKAIIYKKNRQIIIKKLDPKSDSFEYNDKSYIIDKENYYIHRKIAVYSFREEVPIPLALKDLKVIDGKETVDFDKVLMSSDELNTFKRSKTAKEILDTIDKGPLENILPIITLLVTIGGLGALYWILNGQIMQVLEEIQQFREAIGV
jgi:hypothetical protein